MRSSFKTFLEFAGIIYKNSCTVNKKCTLTFLVAFGMRSEGNAPKYGEPRVGFCFTTMLQNTRRFGQGFLPNNNVTKVNLTPYSPNLSPGDFTCPSTEISIESMALVCCYWHHEENDGRTENVSQNGFQECFQHLYRHWQKGIVL